MSVTIYIDLSRFTKIQAEVIAASAAREVVRNAQATVTVGDTGNLKNSITSDKIGSFEWIAYSNTVYAAAQEYGLKPYGKPGYKFNPYMRPARNQVVKRSNIKRIIAESQIVAYNRSKV